MQDGTSKASLELKNDKVIKAFGIGPTEIQKFKDYCIKFGTFMNPSNAKNFMYMDVLSVFKRTETFNQLIFYCKPYFKNSSSDKKNAYNETISKPSFLLKEKEKEIFLNGEVSEIRKVPGFENRGMQRSIKKTIVCLKCLQVDDNLKAQAIRNVFNK